MRCASTNIQNVEVKRRANREKKTKFKYAQQHTSINLVVYFKYTALNTVLNTVLNNTARKTVTALRSFNGPTEKYGLIMGPLKPLRRIFSRSCPDHQGKNCIFGHCTFDLPSDLGC